MQEKLKEELMVECDRLTEIIDNNEPGSEMWKEAYSKKLAVLDKMQVYEKCEGELWSKQEERRITEEHNQEMIALEDRKLEQHLVIETSRNNANIKLEETKQKITWQRVTFEMAKVVVPLGISIIHYNRAQKKVFDFEEHGKITSTCGRDLHLPKIFMK